MTLVPDSQIDLDSASRNESVIHKDKTGHSVQKDARVQEQKFGRPMSYGGVIGVSVLFCNVHRHCPNSNFIYLPVHILRLHAMYFTRNCATTKNGMGGNQMKSESIVHTLGWFPSLRDISLYKQQRRSSRRYAKNDAQ